MGTKPLTQTTGRRKQAVCRARLRPGSGIVKINTRAFAEYFPSEVQRNSSTEALRITNTLASYDVDADIVGGGIAGQSGALRMAIARALVEIDPSQRPVLKKAGLLTRDSRRKESKKYGLKKARKAPQYTKR
ncbi:MAG: 30S ribosomal protein S9 [Actinobacteria bacterium]|nr:30S ribosomal protein S9 [Actinomycetota bacterium]